MITSLLLLSITHAHAAELPYGRPLLPAWSMAGEDGAAATWANPANLGLNPDRSFLLAYSQGLQTDGSAQLGAATQLGPLATGLVYRDTPTAAGQDSWLTLSTGLGLRLDRDLSMGAALGWQIPGGARENFVTWDLGATWRPTSWFGLATVARDLGGTAPAKGIEPTYGPGLVLRPWDDHLLLSAEMLFTDAEGAHPDGKLNLTARIEPTPGWVIRLQGDQDGSLGAGVEASFGRTGAGLFAQAPTTGGALGTAYALSSRSEHQALRVDQRVATFDINGAYPYQSEGGLFSQPTETWLHLEERLRAAITDKSVKGVVLRIHTLPFSLAQVQEFRTLMGRAREAGKPVVAYLDEAADNRAYLLASAADSVYMHPAGTLDLVGLSAQLQFYRETLDMVGVQAQYARRSEYKSGPEPMTRSGSSSAYREQINALLDDLYGAFADDIATGRGRDRADIDTLIDGGPYTASEALARGLVDGLVYPDELEHGLTELPEHYDLDDHYRELTPGSGWAARREIAVILVDNEIVSGESSAPGLLGGARRTGATTVTRQLHQADQEDSVRAIVLRVDSPGGSAFASDDIWRAIHQLHKPVIVSMGGVAASGGYYVASGATAIYASPATITGSIGVYGGKTSFSGLYDKLGVHTETYDRGRNAGMWHSSQPLDSAQLDTLDRMVGDTYDQFKARVAQGRMLDDEQVEEVARGRVWSGARAKELGLVDELGGFADALARAREEADLGPKAKVSLVMYGAAQGPNGPLARRSVEWTRAVLAIPPTVHLPEEFQALDRLRTPGGDVVWALLPYDITVE